MARQNPLSLGSEKQMELFRDDYRDRIKSAINKFSKNFPEFIQRKSEKLKAIKRRYNYGKNTNNDN